MMTNERGTYEQERHQHEDPAAPVPIAPNVVGGGGALIVPSPQVEDDASEAERVANETADPVKERAQRLPPGKDYKEPSQHNGTDGALVSEIQRETGIGGGTLPHEHNSAFVGGGATAQGDDGQRTLLAVPRSDAEQLGVVLEGTHLVLVEGPQQAQGEPWWQVLLPDGRTGWLPATALGSSPFSEDE
jgi:hypothetical protein